MRESRERVRAALLNSGLDFPQKRITVNLAPAHVRKAGPSFDLAIAVGVLAASGQVPQEPLDGCALCGELSLTGELRPVRGALATSRSARGAAATAACSCRRRTPPEAALVDGDRGARDPVARADRRPAARALDAASGPAGSGPSRDGVEPSGLDLADVRGQDDAKRALEIAAAGGHNLLMIGPPGAGKTMLARRLPGILPPPTLRGGARGHAGAQRRRPRRADGSPTERPFRAPHHTISAQGLVGGGAAPEPGEITLAHRGVLFLDELPEFSRAGARRAAPAARGGPGDDHARAARARVPGQRDARRRLQPLPLRAAAGPCSCTAGRAARATCAASAGRCSTGSTSSARSSRLPPLELVRDAERPRELDAVRERVMAARGSASRRRLAGTGALCNGDMDGRLTRRDVPLDGPLTGRMLAARDRLALSGRGHDRVLRVARTIADLDGRDGLSRGRPRRGALVPARRRSTCWPRERLRRRACAAALLIAMLAPRIAGLLDRPRSRVAGAARAAGGAS